MSGCPCHWRTRISRIFFRHIIPNGYLPDSGAWPPLPSVMSCFRLLPSLFSALVLSLVILIGGRYCLLPVTGSPALIILVYHRLARDHTRFVCAGLEPAWRCPARRA